MSPPESAVNYEPKYVALSDIPLTGPGTFNDDAKRKAAADAEAELEAAVNEGTEIPETDREQTHATAANAYASYLLYLGPTDPSSQTRGDTADTGGEAFGFADRLLDIYEAKVASINAAEQDAGEDSGSATPVFSVIKDPDEST